MTRGTALLVALAAAAALAPPALQLTFAIVGIGMVGMVHGAGDLAVVGPARRHPFLCGYAVVSAVTLLWWTLDPSIALPAFLVASGIHFALEDAPGGAWFERLAHGIVLIGAPAVLHGRDYAGLLRAAGGAESFLSDHVAVIGTTGGVAAAVLLALAWSRRDARSAAGIAALLVLPPLVGFTFGFLVLHALPQTAARRDRLGCPSTSAYLRTVAPVAAGALVVTAMAILMLLRFDPTGVRGLFAGIAALAVPHLLVTPWFERRDGGVRPVPTPEPA